MTAIVLPVRTNKIACQDQQATVNRRQSRPTFGSAFSQYNRRLQLERGIEQHFRQEKASGQLLFTITVVYKQPKKPHDVDSCNRLLQQAFLQLCSRLVHRHNYLRPRYAPLMPSLVAFPERDGSDEVHHHGVLAIHPSLEPKLQAFIPDRGWCQLNDQIASSSMDAIYDLRGWLAYCTPSDLAIDSLVWYGSTHRAGPDQFQPTTTRSGP